MNDCAQKTAPAVLCQACGQMHTFERPGPQMVALCCRCGTTIAKRSPRSLQLTAAFTLAALILYIPANFLPILRLDMYGATSQNTVWDGCVMLYKDGDDLVAAIVFLTSIVIPVFKLLALFFLIVSTRLRFTGLKLPRFRVYRIIDAIGRWAMLDVFALAVLVSLVKLERMATVIPGPGLLSFALVVIFIFLASANFDPQLIWESREMAP